jgi:hypothetical protein
VIWSASGALAILEPMFVVATLVCVVLGLAAATVQN